jgi:cyclopropane fatty-acyl-phospholipid synthase-like methyltransferase
METQQKQFSKQEIAQYYDLSEVHYRLFWNLAKSKSLHYGYWDANTKNFHEALLNTNKILADFAGITKEDTVLDAGCGVGGSSVWLSKNIGCKVTGITLSKKQAMQATQYAAAQSVGDLASFAVNDYTNTGYPENSFSVVWAVETVCHAPDKSDFLREAARVLKPGGRLIMADFFKKAGLAGKDARMIKDWANGWAVDDYATREEFERMLQNEGFTNVRIIDASEAVMPSIKKLYRAYLLGVIPSRIYNLFHPNATEFGKRNVDTARLQYITMKKKLWNYLIVYAEKSV